MRNLLDDSAYAATTTHPTTVLPVNSHRRLEGDQYQHRYHCSVNAENKISQEVLREIGRHYL